MGPQRTETTANQTRVEASKDPSWLDRVLHLLPQGETLPMDAWAARHKAVLWVVAAHIPFLFAFGVYGGRDTLFTRAVYEAYAVHLAGIETGVIALFVLIGAWPRLSPRIRSASAALGLITSSAVLVQFSGGFIEAHFHFFAALALLALYEDWVPFLLGIGYVLVHHGTIGTIAPGSVYNHPTALAYPWRWAGVHALFVTGLCASLTTTWRMSERTRSERQRVLEAAGDGILAVDLEHHITMANPAAATMLETDQDALLGRPLHEVLDWTQPPGELPGPHEAIPWGPMTAGEGRLRRADGDTLDVEVTIRPIQELGQQAGAVITLKDISTQKHTQDELAEHVERLEHNNQRWRELAHVVSHDLQEPTRMVVSYAQMLARKDSEFLDDDTEEFLSYITQGAMRMRDLVKDLQTFTKLETETPTFTQVPLEDVLAEVQHRLSFLIEDTDAHVTTGDLPTVQGDRSHLVLLFENLVSNGIKFSDETPRVHIDAHEHEDAWTIAVEDNGIGMNPAYHERIFRMFERLQDAPVEGQGIGLTICKTIVARHGGSIQVDSQPGEGSTFHITIPKGATPSTQTLHPGQDEPPT